MDKMKPSDYKYPWNSVLQDGDTETVAKNIMAILKRTGNEFRPLSWEEYKTERLKDFGYSDAEKAHFDKVINYCKSPDTAQLLCEDWATPKT